MNLGIFLSSGESFSDMENHGQKDRYVKLYLPFFAKYFKKIYIFSYENELVFDLPANVFLIPNKYNLHRYLYGFCLPFINIKIILKCNVFRAYHLLGVLPAIISRIFMQKPFVYNYGYDYMEFAQIENKSLQWYFLKIVKPLANLSAAKIFATTKMVFDWIPKNKTIYLPHSVDTNLFKPIKVKRNRVPIILSVGRLENQKNYFNLIKAMKMVKAKLLIVGSGSLKSKLIDLAAKNGVNLEVIDRIDNTKLPIIYNRANIFILPSISEGHSKVILEAMACEVPVIGSKVRGIDEIIADNKNGIFCQLTAKSIAEKINFLLSNKELAREMGQRARRFILKDYQLPKLLKKEVDTLIWVARND